MGLFDKAFDVLGYHQILEMLAGPKKQDYMPSALPDIPGLNDPEVVAAGDAQKRLKKVRTQLAGGLLAQPTLGQSPLFPM